MNADPRPVFARAADQAAALIATVLTDDLDKPTPCAEFDVRTLLSHLTGATVRLAVVAEGGNPSDIQPFAEDVPDSGWATAYDEIRARATQAWAPDDHLDAVMLMPFGEMPGRAVVSAFVLETVTHTWDLAEALGRSVALDPELAEFALAVAHQMLPDAQRGGNSAFGPAQDVADDAGAYEKLAAWLGRKPRTRA
ncbi:TIGR03086 family metal-binding protein [Nocardia sp. R6R-6]|uniref:TIGR03086 family metal-binding protein n=1 Tax=Nocardia sp. R6R-6 TaxID=3459303 RepID=UPI00403D8048